MKNWLRKASSYELRGAWLSLRAWISQFLGREILVDPADGFVLRPNLRPCLPQLGFFGLDAAAVEQVQHFIERLLPRIEAVGRIVGVEQHADFVREQPAQPVQKMPIGDILMAGVEQPLVRRGGPPDRT